MAGIEDLGSGWWGGASAGLGGIADIWSLINNLQGRGDQQRIYDILANPAKLAKYIEGLYRPLTGAATDAVRRDLGAGWAGMTGGATGGAYSQFIADALAKLETQRYSDIAGKGIGALQGSLAGIPSPLPMNNLSGVMRSLAVLRQLQPGASKEPGITDFKGGYTDPAAYQDVSNPLPTGIDYGNIQL